jgi:hypothetical protein
MTYPDAYICMVMVVLGSKIPLQSGAIIIIQKGRKFKRYDVNNAYMAPQKKLRR